jgi:hypothetical protein
MGKYCRKCGGRALKAVIKVGNEVDGIERRVERRNAKT